MVKELKNTGSNTKYISTVINEVKSSIHGYISRLKQPPRRVRGGNGSNRVFCSWLYFKDKTAYTSSDKVASNG